MMNVAATGSYSNIYRLKDYEERVSNLTKFFKTETTDSFLDKGEDYLTAQINELQKKEKALLGIIEGIDTIEELEEHFNNINKYIVNFSGPEMYKQFILPLENENIKDFTAFQEAADNVVAEWATEEGIVLEAQEEITNMIFNRLNEGHSGGQYRRRATKTYSNYMEAILDTPARRNRLIELLKNVAKTEKIEIKKNGKVQTKEISEKTKATLKKLDITSNGQQVEIKTWFDITDKSTQKQAKNKSPNQKLNDARDIWTLISSKAGNANLTLLKQCYVHILKESHLTEFYVGKNEKEVIGFLGELSALYYFCLLFNTTPNNLESKVGVVWKGGKINPSTGKKYHQDLFLRIAESELGVQVKNTAKDLFAGAEMNISFWKVGLPEFLNRMKKLGLSMSTINALENYFRTYQFNVPYIKETGKYIQRESQSNAVFVEDRNNLTNINKDVDILLSIFAASFMYMDISDNLEGQKDRNILFLFGGGVLKTASQLLRQVRDNLKTIGNPIRITSSISKGGYNIVSSLNNDASNIYKQHKEETMGEGLKDVKIAAQYTFNLMSFLNN